LKEKASLKSLYDNYLYKVKLSRYNYYMSKNIERLINIKKEYSAFLWGARKTGKSHWIRYNYNPEKIILIDLLENRYIC
jgi:predicted AAA+ superfamily ATPase